MQDNGQSPDQTITYRYRFAFQDGKEKVFDVTLTHSTLRLVQPEHVSYPTWTALNCHRCPNCPLSPDEHKHCPVAMSLVDVIDFFEDSVSYEQVAVTIDTEARQYHRQATLQMAISSLIGIYMVASGCPIMERLKPMVMAHLPFATPEETAYRVVSMYLLAQYFRRKHGQVPDWDLDGLADIYEEIRTVNRSFVRRLSTAGVQDATVNAVVTLDTFATYVTFPGDENILNLIEPSFHAYLE